MLRITTKDKDLLAVCYKLVAVGAVLKSANSNEKTVLIEFEGDKNDLLKIEGILKID